MYKILIVDDSEVFVKMIKVIIENNFDANVIIATSGRMAISKLSEKPDLIIMDIVMPGMDGFQTTQKIRKNPEYEEIPIIFLTGNDPKKEFIEKGINKEQVLSIGLNGSEIRSKAEIFKEEILNLGGVKTASNSNAIPGGSSKSIMVFEFDSQPEIQPMVTVINIDTSYLETLGIELLSGRNFSYDYSTDTANFIVNEKLVREVGLGPNPVGKNITQQGVPGVIPDINGVIIGVIKDYHFSSLHEQIEPLALNLNKSSNRTVVKMYKDDIQKTREQIKSIWEKYSPRPFDAEFIDLTFDANYNSEVKLGKIFIYFTLIAIFIACLGLYGLASFSAEQRVKEIGIRKVLGSKVNQIVLMLSKEYMILIIVSTILGWIGAYIIIEKWLVLFPYKINILSYSWIFISASIIASIIALLTISLRSVKTANSNPVDALRYE